MQISKSQEIFQRPGYNSEMQEPKKGIYEHYKGGRFEVLGVVSHSETLEKMVHYKHLDDDQSEWVRPLPMFMGTVTVNDVILPRFRYLGTHK